ncbi:30S ribosomal protein S3 [Candidatus Micrarchaeota archaeon]|nr:30S ribosomal protein S3 [Candidatus Micrarchaeota archaeon]
MAIEKKFLQKSVDQELVKEYLEEALSHAGISSITIQKTPLATRIALRVRRPSVVIGKKGANIKSVSEELKRRFHIDNPQLDVMEVNNPTLDAKLIAERIGRQIEIEGKIKQIIRFNIRDIMNAGAYGTEIIVAGKIVGKGGKARTIRMRKGYLKKSGDVMKLVETAKFTAYGKAGAIGIVVKILPPGVVFPDSVKIDYEKLKTIGLTETVEPTVDAEQEKMEEEKQAAVAKLKKKMEQAKKAARPKKMLRAKSRKPKAAMGVHLPEGHVPQILTARDEPPKDAKKVEKTVETEKDSKTETSDTDAA